MIRQLFAFAVCLALLFAPSVASAKPFKAKLTGTAAPDFSGFPVVTNTEVGEGTATHLGKFQWDDQEVATFNPDGTFSVVGTFTMTAANGDELYGTFETAGFINMSGQLVIHGEYVFNGGSGRFAHASGTGTLDALANGPPLFDFSGTFNGTLNY